MRRARGSRRFRPVPSASGDLSLAPGFPIRRAGAERAPSSSLTFHYPVRSDPARGRRRSLIFRYFGASLLRDAAISSRIPRNPPIRGRVSHFGRLKRNSFPSDDRDQDAARIAASTIVSIDEARLAFGAVLRPSAKSETTLPRTVRSCSGLTVSFSGGLSGRHSTSSLF